MFSLQILVSTGQPPLAAGPGAAPAPSVVHRGVRGGERRVERGGEGLGTKGGGATAERNAGGV